MEVSQGRNRVYFLIFPHMTPPPPGDDDDGDDGGGTPPANPTAIPNVGRDKIGGEGSYEEIWGNTSYSCLGTPPKIQERVFLGEIGRAHV